MMFVAYTPRIFLTDSGEEKSISDTNWEEPCDAVLLFESDGHVWWTVTFGLTRREVDALGWEIGSSRPNFCMESDVYPSWFNGVDLVELDVRVQDMLYEHRADPEQWLEHWPAPLMKDAQL